MQSHWSQASTCAWNYAILPCFCLVSHSKRHKLPSFTTWRYMTSHREISRLTTDMNTITGSGRPSRNSQGICSTSCHPTKHTTLPSEAQGVPVNPQFPEVYWPRMVPIKLAVPQVHHLPRDRLKLLYPAYNKMTGLLTLRVIHINLVL